MKASQLGLFESTKPPRRRTLSEVAREFCDRTPHRQLPYSRRDWGGPLHALCSYQGKLKPAIAHYLVSWFTKTGDRILDPLAGVGTIPLEARRLGRVAVANDLSPVAEAVTRAKLEPFDPSDVWKIVQLLKSAMDDGPSSDQLASEEDIDFGLNGAIREYFHEETLREVLIARRFFLRADIQTSLAARDLVRANILHILHGNRPYALSRRSHPVTPFAPSGPYEYRSLLERLTQRLERLLPLFEGLQASSPDGEVYGEDFRTLRTRKVDAVITSPPFAKSLRFWSMNWMRLWFAGWNREDFEHEPGRYLETQQRKDFEPYREFRDAMARVVKPEGLLIMHLGETRKVNMAYEIAPLLEPDFRTVFVGRESVVDTESHGLTDKGSTVAHWYLFALRA